MKVILRRVLALMISAIMLLGIFPTSAIAAEAQCVLTVDSASALAGSTVEINVSIKNNPGILGANLRLSYDDDILTLVNATNGEAFSKEITYLAPSKYKNGCSFIWYGSNTGEVKDGAILTLTFKVSENAPTDYEMPITVSFDERDIIAPDYSTVPLKVIPGGIYLPTT